MDLVDKYVSLYKEALLESLRNLHTFWFAIISTWFLTEAVAPSVGYDTSAVTGGFFCLGLIGYPAAASIGLGRWQQGPFSLTIERTSTVIDYYLFVILVFVAIIVISLLAQVFVDLESVGFTWLAGGASTLVVGWLLFRLWPVFNIAFLYPGYSRWSVSAEANVWVGPGFSTARRMSAQQDFLRDATLPLAVPVICLIGSYLVIRSLLAEEGMSLTVINGLFYGLVLPYIAILADKLAEPFKVSNEFEQVELEGEEAAIPEDEVTEAVVNKGNDVVGTAVAGAAVERTVVDRAGIEDAAESSKENPRPENCYQPKAFNRVIPGRPKCAHCEEVTGKMLGREDEPYIIKEWHLLDESVGFQRGRWSPRLFSCNHCENIWVFRFDQYDGYHSFYEFPKTFLPLVDGNIDAQQVAEGILHPDANLYWMMQSYREFYRELPPDPQVTIDCLATAAVSQPLVISQLECLLELLSQTVRLASACPPSKIPTREIDTKQLQALTDEELNQELFSVLRDVEENYPDRQSPVTVPLQPEYLISLFELVDDENLYQNLELYQQCNAKNALLKWLNSLLDVSHRALEFSETDLNVLINKVGFKHRLARHCVSFNQARASIAVLTKSLIQELAITANELVPTKEEDKKLQALNEHYDLLDDFCKELVAANRKKRAYSSVTVPLRNTMSQLRAYRKTLA